MEADIRKYVWKWEMLPLVALKMVRELLGQEYTLFVMFLHVEL